MSTRLLNTRKLKAGWAGLATAVQEVATRTDRAVQLARLRIALWDLNRELMIAYREFGQRVADLALSIGTGSGRATQGETHHRQVEIISPDDPELIRVAGVIERILARMETLTQQIAALHLESPGETGAMLRKRLQTAGLTELVAVIPRRSPLAGTPLSDVRPMTECVIMTIIRNETPFVPDGVTKLLSGDEVVLFGSALACEQAKVFLERTAEETFPQTL
jgi:K+/H+ antiporter YhaU regulatory subunit KhtT